MEEPTFECGIQAFGHRFIVEPSGTRLTDDERCLLKHLRPAGVMFRRRNFIQTANYDTWLAEYRTLVESIRQAIERPNLLLCVDHEGGTILRPPPPVTRFPYAAHWGSRVSEVGAAMALELQSLAINVNFAPVADIHLSADNPVINERAFGSTPADVTAKALSFAASMRDGAVLPCAKHFPGHGRTKEDSHRVVAALDIPASQLREVELRPFAALIAAGVPLVMTAHILLPSIDTTHTVTTSHAALSGILRGELGFDGAIVSDALGMGGILAELDKPSFIYDVVNAGLDLLLVTGNTVSIDTAVALATRMHRAFVGGSISEEALDQTRTRIGALLAEAPRNEVRTLSPAVFEGHAELLADLNRVTAASTFVLKVEGFE